MKTLNLKEMEVIEGGGKERDCAVLGLLAVAAFATGPLGWGAAALGGLTGIGVGVVHGCLN